MATSDRELRLRRISDVDEFDRLAGDFLRSREAEHNLILGICSNLRTAKSAFAPSARQPAPLPPYFAVVFAGEAVVGAAMRTPPLNAILSATSDVRAVELVAVDLLRDMKDLPGVLGDRLLARRFAELWTERTGRTHRIKTAQRIFQLTRVVAPRPTSGHMRVAARADLDVIARWFAEFIREALREDGSEGRNVAEYWLTTPGRTLYIWDDDGPVSMCGAAGRTPSGMRIGAVYTPSELRGRGYASNCVATASQAQLDAGVRFCFLFTDLANPTSNHIYQTIDTSPCATWTNIASRTRTLCANRLPSRPAHRVAHRASTRCRRARACRRRAR